jgi:hypothetical protein
MFVHMERHVSMRRTSCSRNGGSPRAPGCVENGGSTPCDPVHPQPTVLHRGPGKLRAQPTMHLGRTAALSWCTVERRSEKDGPAVNWGRPMPCVIVNSPWKVQSTYRRMTIARLQRSSSSCVRRCERTSESGWGRWHRLPNRRYYPTPTGRLVERHTVQ